MKLLRIDTHAHYYGDGKWIKLQYGGLLTSHNFHYNGGGEFYPFYFVMDVIDKNIFLNTELLTRYPSFQVTFRLSCTR